MTLKRTILPFFLGLLIVTIAFPIISKADIWSGSKTWAGYTRLVYTPSVASFGYTSIYNEATNNWTGKSTKVTFSRGNGTHANDDKYHVANTSTPNLLGRIVPYNGNQVGTGNYWGYVRVYVYDNTFNKLNYSRSQRVATATHEVGHSLKLAHPSSSTVSSVMHQGSKKALKPTSYDVQELKRKWGN